MKPPPPPPQLELLRTVRSAVVPWKTYAIVDRDDRPLKILGSDLIWLAETLIVLADSQRTGDTAAHERALSRLGARIRPEDELLLDRTLNLIFAEIALRSV